MSKEFDIARAVCLGRHAEWGEVMDIDQMFYGRPPNLHKKFWIYRKWAMLRRRMIGTLTDEQAHRGMV